MTKDGLVGQLALDEHLSRKEAEPIVEAVFAAITEALCAGDKVELRGFGTFKIRHRPGRRGRNPKTGAPVDIPNKRVAVFKVGRALKQVSLVV